MTLYKCKALLIFHAVGKAHNWGSFLQAEVLPSAHLPGPELLSSSRGCSLGQLPAPGKQICSKPKRERQLWDATIPYGHPSVLFGRRRKRPVPSLLPQEDIHSM